MSLVWKENKKWVVVLSVKKHGTVVIQTRIDYVMSAGRKNLIIGLNTMGMGMGIKASKICCPIKGCGEIITEEKITPGQSQLVDLFETHLLRHDMIIYPEFREELHTRILFIRSNGKIPYQDPFIVVPPEKLK